MLAGAPPSTGMSQTIQILKKVVHNEKRMNRKNVSRNDPIQRRIQVMEAEEHVPLIVAFVSDLMFAVRIENAARQLNYRVEVVDSPGRFQKTSADLSDNTQIQLILALSSWQPALLIFDLGSRPIPWREWIPWIKSAEPTREIPILCYGSHVDTESMKSAKALGARAVVARSRFSSALPELMKKYSRQKT